MEIECKRDGDMRETETANLDEIHEVSEDTRIFCSFQ